MQKKHWYNSVLVLSKEEIDGNFVMWKKNIYKNPSATLVLRPIEQNREFRNRFIRYMHSQLQTKKKYYCDSLGGMEGLFNKWC